jgi:aminoglycoside/choline kinase family phosphotransferase
MPAPELSPIFATLREGGYRPVDALAMTGDVSQRRYFRLALLGKPASAILALYPLAMRAAERRYRIATALFSGASLRVPAILAAAEDGTWMLTEDLGLETVFDLRSQPFEALETHFRAAVEALPRIAALDRGLVAGLNPALDEALLRRELAMTRRVFFETQGLALDGATVMALEALCERLGSERRVPCHRDLNVRNLLPLAGGEVGIVDHQDLRLGPAAYDLASLLNDSLFPPPAAEERLLSAAGVLDREPYHRAAAQRTLKAVGTYAAFADRSPRYLPLIAPTLRRALEHLARTPETAAVAPRLADAWRGVLADGSLLH